MQVLSQIGGSQHFSEPEIVLASFGNIVLAMFQKVKTPKSNYSLIFMECDKSNCSSSNKESTQYTGAVYNTVLEMIVDSEACPVFLFVCNEDNAGTDELCLGRPTDCQLHPRSSFQVIELAIGVCLVLIILALMATYFFVRQNREKRIQTLMSVPTEESGNLQESFEENRS